ncbi:MAG TPA: hypothetical protein PLQ89_01630 [Phycisphaerae bacterium]|mgnify:FL=1|nr:hypothetical protein [Phycisphaerae bacterium]
MSHRAYTWEYRVEVKPYDKIVDVLEAFFASYPAGDYTCERRETYRLQFRRGEWRKSLFGLGNLVPAALPKGAFNRWPVIVYVLVRPSPETFLVTIRYEVHLPRSIPMLIPEVQDSVNQHCLKELDDLATYLAECTGMPHKPAVKTQ